MRFKYGQNTISAWDCATFFWMVMFSLEQQSLVMECGGLGLGVILVVVEGAAALCLVWFW